jgi:hypothetical protein
MNPRLQAGLELQLEKQAHQEHDSSLSGVLGQYFKQAAEDVQVPPAAQQTQASTNTANSGMVMSTMLRGISRI